MFARFWRKLFRTFEPPGQARFELFRLCPQFFVRETADLRLQRVDAGDNRPQFFKQALISRAEDFSKRFFNGVHGLFTTSKLAPSIMPRMRGAPVFIDTG